jgi:hypothetical protein
VHHQLRRKNSAKKRMPEDVHWPLADELVASVVAQVHETGDAGHGPDFRLSFWGSNIPVAQALRWSRI